MNLMSILLGGMWGAIFAYVICIFTFRHYERKVNHEINDIRSHLSYEISKLRWHHNECLNILNHGKVIPKNSG